MSKPSGASGFSGQWWALLTSSAIVLLAIALLPVDSIERSILARGAGLVASVIFCCTFVTFPKQVRPVWLCMGGFLILTAVGDVIYDYQSLVLEVSAFPGIADLPYLASYGFAATGLFLLARRLNPAADLSTWIDISIMVVAAAGIVGAFVIGPFLNANPEWDLATILSLVYPLLDLVLLAALVRLLMLPHARNAAISLLAIAMALFLGYDLIYNNQLLAAVWTPVGAMEVVWTAAMLCIPLAALSPGAQQFDPVDPNSSGIVTTTRQLMIGVSVLAVPAIVLLELAITGSIILNWLIPVIVILIALVLARLHLLLRTAQRQARALAEYERADFLTGLPSRQTWNERIQSHSETRGAATGVLTIAILAIDNLADTRASKGANIADLLLLSATIAWLGELTDEDLLARYGPESFALLMQRDSMTEAQAVLRRVVRATPSDLTVSSGAALLRPDEAPAAAEQRAMGAMHASRAGVLPRFEIEQNISS